MREKKAPDPLIGARIDEVLRQHRAYKRAFVRGDAMRTLTHLLARALAVPEDVRSEEEGMLIELVLALLLNILHTAHPDAPPPPDDRPTSRRCKVAEISWYPVSGTRTKYR